MLRLGTLDFAAGGVKGNSKVSAYLFDFWVLQAIYMPSRGHACVPSVHGSRQLGALRSGRGEVIHPSPSLRTPRCGVHVDDKD